MRTFFNKLISKIDNVPTELYLAIYLWGFAILRPVLNLFQKYSTVILLIYVSLLLICFLIKTQRDKLKISYKVILFIFIICSIFVFDYAFRRNDYTFKYFYNFIIYGIIPMVLTLYGINAKVFLEYYSKIAFVVLGFSLIMPFFNISFIGNYMDLGYTYLLPAFIGSLMYKLLYNKFKIIVNIMLVIAFVEIAVYANRGAFLSAVVFLLIYFFVITKQYKNVRKTATLMGLVIIALCFGKQMFNIVYNFLEERGMYSYSLKKIYDSFTNADYLSFLSGRDELWKEQYLYFIDNPLFGNGTGYFQSQNNNHLFSHNIFMEVLCSYGLVGFIFLITGIITAALKYYQMDSDTKNVFWLFFILWCPTLLLSQYLYINQGFWLFFTFILLYKNDEIQESIEVKEFVI